MSDETQDQRYLELLWKALHVCARYRPMFGKGRKGGLSLPEFQAVYRADPSTLGWGWICR
jgi:hypothetical protein